jgi:hypothetical protein
VHVESDVLNNGLRRYIHYNGTIVQDFDGRLLLRGTGFDQKILHTVLLYQQKNTLNNRQSNTHHKIKCVLKVAVHLGYGV